MTKSSPKTIFITSFHFLAARNFFTTDAYDELKNAPELRIVVFVPDFKLDYYRKQYDAPNTVFEGIEESKLARSFWYRFFRLLSLCLQPTYSNLLVFQELAHGGRAVRGGSGNSKPTLKNKFNYRLAQVLSGLFGKFRPLHRLVQMLDVRLCDPNTLAPYIAKYHPICLVSLDIFGGSDSAFLLASRRLKLPVVGMVRSWDNTTTKGLIRAVPERLVVNNEIIADEAVELHGIKRETIFVGGIPQFDQAIGKAPTPREEFFRRVGADPSKRLLLFAPAGYILSDTDWQICELLRKAIDQNKLPADIQVLVRSHPSDPAQLEKFHPDPRFVIDRPGLSFRKSAKVTELRASDQQHLLDSLYHSEVLIHVSSTIGLDSLLLDKPQIMIEFDGWESYPYLESVRRFHDEDHMKVFLATGAARIARTPDELVDAATTYLADPSKERKNRQLAARQQIRFLDGQAGKRVGRFLVQTVGELESKAASVSRKSGALSSTRELAD